MMQKKLGLTADQNKKVYDIILKYAQQMETVRTAPSGGDRRQQVMTINTNRDNDIKAVLTPDQLKKYEAEREVRKEKMQERKANGMNGGN